MRQKDIRQGKPVGSVLASGAVVLAALIVGFLLADIARNGGAPDKPPSLGEQLLRDLQAAPGITAGVQDAPGLEFVIDPACPHCKAVWRELRQAILTNKVRVHLIPITNNPEGDDTRVGAVLLKTANPFNAWDKYVAGDASALSGEADSPGLQAVLGNNLLIEKWNIRGIPYIVYRAKDGRVKIVQGEPEKLTAILSDMMR
jgi:hypothetical protein